MSTVLILAVKKVIEQTRQYASSRGRNLYKKAQNYFRYFTDKDDDDKKLTERVSRLKGIVKVGPDFDYKKILDEERTKKYGI